MCLCLLPLHFIPLFLCFLFDLIFFPFPDACLHVIESEPGAGCRPGVHQPNKLSAQYQARPAGKKLFMYVCVCVYLCVHVSVIGVTPLQPSHNYHTSARTVRIQHVITHLRKSCMVFMLFMYLSLRMTKNAFLQSIKQHKQLLYKVYKYTVLQ